MKISCVLNTHVPNRVSVDTLDSIRTHMTKDVCLLIDRPCWGSFVDFEPDMKKIKGLKYRGKRGPYRNLALGLLELYKHNPNSDWYNYIEYDCLILGSHFKRDLENKRNYYCLGFNYRKHRPGWKLKIINSILDEDLKEHHYCIGCCLFFSKQFVKKMVESKFLERLIEKTEFLKNNSFPDFDGYAFEEELYPSLAAHFGGKVGNIGKEPNYMVRWQPDLKPEEVPHGARILHPIKKYENPIRNHYSKVREAFKK